MAQLQERYRAWHEMRSRSMKFTLWVLGLTIGASWHLLQNPCECFGQRLALSGLVVALGVASFYFLTSLSRGVQTNRKALISVETDLCLHAQEKPVLPKEYQSTKRRWSSHFLTLYGLIIITGLYLLLSIWIPTTDAATERLSNRGLLENKVDEGPKPTKADEVKGTAR